MLAPQGIPTVTFDQTETKSYSYEMYDDWEDNKLTSRDSMSETPLSWEDAISRSFSLSESVGSLPYSGEFTYKYSYTIESINTFRPEWTTESGSPSASEGMLVLTAGDVTVQRISIPSTFFVGAWESDVRYTASPGTGGLWPIGFYLNGSLKYHHAWKYSDTHYLYDQVDGVRIIAHAHAVDTAWHTMKLTRDSDGNWETFFDGAACGSTTDTTTTSCDEYRVWNGSDVETRFDNWKVY